MNIVIRKADIGQADEIRKMVNNYASKNKMLPRSLNEIYENIRDYHVAIDGEKVVGSGALHVFWEDLAELRSLAVHPDYQGRGLGRKLVGHVLSEAPDLGISRVFILTAIPGYFKKAGFEFIDRCELPHKVWSECIKCPKFPDCDEVSMIIEV